MFHRLVVGVWEFTGKGEPRYSKDAQDDRAISHDLGERGGLWLESQRQEEDPTENAKKVSTDKEPLLKGGLRLHETNLDGERRIA